MQEKEQVLKLQQKNKDKCKKCKLFFLNPTQQNDDKQK